MREARVLPGFPLHNPDAHAFALAWIDQLMGAEEGTIQGEELSCLAVLVEAYEAIYYPMESEK